MRNLLRIRVTKSHDLRNGAYNSKIYNFPAVMLESDSRENNLKTLHIAQRLMKEGFKTRLMQMYKGSLLRIILSKMKPDEPFKAKAGGIRSEISDEDRNNEKSKEVIT